MILITGFEELTHQEWMDALQPVDCLYRLCAVCSGYLEFLGCILWWVELPSGHCFLVWFSPLNSTFAIILKVTHISLIDSLRWNSVSIFYSVASPHLGRLNECVCCILPGTVCHATWADLTNSSSEVETHKKIGIREKAFNYPSCVR